MTIETLIARFGLAAVFVGAGIEGETMVVTGGLLAHDGLLPLAGVATGIAAGWCDPRMTSDINVLIPVGGVPAEYQVYHDKRRCLIAY